MMRVIRALLGLSRRDADAGAQADEHRAEHAMAMRAVNMKVAAMERGADRLSDDSRKTEEAARILLARLREDFPE